MRATAGVLTGMLAVSSVAVQANAISLPHRQQVQRVNHSLSQQVSALTSEAVANEFVGLINRDRVGRGLAELRIDPVLASSALVWSQQMASVDDISHDPNLRSVSTPWRALAENVGMGPDAATIHQAFVNSPGHARNMFNPAMGEVGIGVTITDGPGGVPMIFVVERFQDSAGTVARVKPGQRATPVNSDPAIPSQLPRTKPRRTRR
jgi:uncharacterized protein YkwD